MRTRRSRYLRHRFPPEVISHAVWVYHQLGLSLRQVEDLLAKRGIIVSYESVRQWCRKFGPDYARRLKRRQGGQNSVPRRALRHHERSAPVPLARVLVQRRRDGRAARRFFRKLLKSQRRKPFRIVTDKLGSYRVAHRTVMPLVTHDTGRYTNNRAEVSHQPIRQRERQMRGFKSADNAQQFLHAHDVIQNLFRLSRHRLRAVHHRMPRARSFATWAAMTAA